jgi:hypothetical protein
MELQKKLQKVKIHQGKKTAISEHERLLMQYAGIFKHNIPEYAEMIAKKQRTLINFSR